MEELRELIRTVARPADFQNSVGRELSRSLRQGFDLSWRVTTASTAPACQLSPAKRFLGRGFGISPRRR